MFCGNDAKTCTSDIFPENNYVILLQHVPKEYLFILKFVNVYDKCNDLMKITSQPEYRRVHSQDSNYGVRVFADEHYTSSDMQLSHLLCISQHLVMEWHCSIPQFGFLWNLVLGSTNLQCYCFHL